MRIIISRTDAIGDVVLTLPMAGVLKKLIPGCKVIFLGKTYTIPVFSLSEHVDHVINFDEIKTSADLVEKMKALHADAFIHVFPRKEIAVAVYKSGIPIRIGTSHRLYHLLTCNKLIALGRKNSNLHEAQLNLKFLEVLGLNGSVPLNEIKNYFGFSNVPSLPEKFRNHLKADTFNLILHPFSNASAREWPLNSYLNLIHSLNRKKFNILITGQKQENETVNNWLKSLPDFVTDCTGTMTLEELISFIHASDALVACSTGPLHIAAALKKYVVGLYPPIRPMHSGRWGSLGEHAENLSIDKSCSDCKGKPLQCKCMNEISVKAVLEKVNGFQQEYEKLFLKNRI